MQIILCLHIGTAAELDLSRIMKPKHYGTAAERADNQNAEQLNIAPNQTAEILTKAADIKPMQPARKICHTDTISQRLSVVEATLRVQDATGASHLQQLERRPKAFGLASSARPAIRRLRRQRNQALHGGSGVSDRVAEIETRMGRKQ